MKLLARLSWVFIIFLLVTELIIFRQAISYHTTDSTPIKLSADNQSRPTNRYVEFPAALQSTPPLLIKAPGYEVHIYQHPRNKDIFIYDLDGRFSAHLEKKSESDTVTGRLLPLKDAPFSTEVHSHFNIQNTPPAYALLLHVKPQKSTFYIYLTAILLTVLLLALYPFLGKSKK